MLHPFSCLAVARAECFQDVRKGIVSCESGADEKMARKIFRQLRMGKARLLESDYTESNYTPSGYATRNDYIEIVEQCVKYAPETNYLMDITKRFTYIYAESGLKPVETLIQITLDTSIKEGEELVKQIQEGYATLRSMYRTPSLKERIASWLN